MKLIVGLGNPGKKYEKTRHNIGFLALDEFAKEYNLNFSNESNLFGYVAENPEVILLKPNTFMNLSGKSIKRLLDYYKNYSLEPNDIIIVHDDIDISFGNIKIQKGKSEAGHKGVISTVEHLGTVEFWRVRIGTGGEKLIEIKRNNRNINTYVLGYFDKAEKKQLPIILKHVVDALNICLKDGPGAAAQQYNQKTTNEV